MRAWINSAMGMVAGSLLLAMLPSGSTGADVTRLRTEITALLNDGWPLGPEGVAAAIVHFESATAIAPLDVRPAFAMAVVQIRQRRYNEAAKLLDEVLRLKSDHLVAWQAKVWLSMVARRYDAALADVETMLDAWPVEANSADTAVLDDTSRFLGRVLGFLWGPAHGKVDEDRLTEIEKRIETKLATIQRAVFDESRGTVLGKFTNLQDKTDTTREQAKLDEEKQKEQDRDRLKSETQSVNTEKGTIDQQAASARAAAQGQLQTLTTAMQSLDAEFNQLAARGAAVQADVARLLAQEQSLIALANRTDDDFEKRRLLGQAAAIQVTRAQAEAAYLQLDAQARRVNAQRQTNLQQQNQVQAAFQGEMKRLGLKAESLARTEKRIASDLKKATTPATGMTTGVRSLTTTSAAFVTYFDFPVEREKRRIIDSLQ